MVTEEDIRRVALSLPGSVQKTATSCSRPGRARFSSRLITTAIPRPWSGSARLTRVRWRSPWLSRGGSALQSGCPPPTMRSIRRHR